MKYDYAVKHNGVYYPAGTEVPVGNAPKAETKAEPKKEEVKEEPKPKVEPKKTTKK